MENVRNKTGCLSFNSQIEIKQQQTKKNIKPLYKCNLFANKS